MAKEMLHVTIEEAINSERLKGLGDEVKELIDKGAGVTIYKEINKFSDGVQRLGNGQTIIINSECGPNLHRIIDVIENEFKLKYKMEVEEKGNIK